VAAQDNKPHFPFFIKSFMLAYNTNIMIPGYKMYLVFLFGSLALAIGLQLILPFPYGIAVSLGLFIVFPLVARKVLANRMHGAGKWGGLEFSKIEKACTSCGLRSSGRQCKRCGSMSFRMR